MVSLRSPLCQFLKMARSNSHWREMLEIVAFFSHLLDHGDVEIEVLKE